MTQADRIIAKFGTQLRLAKAAGVSQPTVALWKFNGTIPPRYFDAILRRAAKEGIPLTLNDFLTPALRRHFGALLDEV